MASRKTTEQSCPCGSPRSYVTCCGIYHAGGIAPTAEALMRSRYSAYVLSLEPYLLATWHPDTRPQSLGLDREQPTRWLGLEIKHGKLKENSGEAESATVEFVARYKISGRAYRLHEVSRFLRQDGRWLYVDGKTPVKETR